MTTLDDVTALARPENGLAVISTLRADGTIQSIGRQRGGASNIRSGGGRGAGLS